MIESNVATEDEYQVSTKDRIMDAAEHLFAERGFEATSLRMITSAAGVNLAAVNYHFHSKDDLIRAVFVRRIGPFVKARLDRLNAYLDVAGSGPLELEPVIRAFVEPALVFRANPGCADIGRLFGRTYVEPSAVARRVFFDLMREAGRPFTEAFRRASPGISQVELIWKIHFSIGVMAHTLAGNEHLKVISGGLCDTSDTEALVERVVAFIAAGVRSPVDAPSKRS